MLLAERPRMRSLLFVLLIAGCHRHHTAPSNAQLGESTARGPVKPVEEADDSAVKNVDAPVGTVKPATSPNDTAPPSDPPPDVP
jgi:hypothetical protein